MRYIKNHLKDEELPTLLFIVESLLDSVFGKEYIYVRNKDIKNFIEDIDSAESTIKPVSITVVKNILALIKFDTRYRPKYTSIEFLIYGLLQKKKLMIQ